MGVWVCGCGAAIGGSYVNGYVCVRVCMFLCGCVSVCWYGAATSGPYVCGYMGVRVCVLLCVVRECVGMGPQQVSRIYVDKWV